MMKRIFFMVSLMTFVGITNAMTPMTLADKLDYLERLEQLASDNPNYLRELLKANEARIHVLTQAANRGVAGADARLKRAQWRNEAIHRELKPIQRKEIRGKIKKLKEKIEELESFEYYPPRTKELEKAKDQLEKAREEFIDLL